MQLLAAKDARERETGQKPVAIICTHSCDFRSVQQQQLPSRSLPLSLPLRVLRLRNAFVLIQFQFFVTGFALTEPIK